MVQMSGSVCIVVNLNCRPIMEARECARGVLGSPVCDVDMPEIMELSYQMQGIMIDYICRDNIDGMRFTSLFHEVCL